jgi:hypothetical protein
MVSSMLPTEIASFPNFADASRRKMSFIIRND